MNLKEYSVGFRLKPNGPAAFPRDKANAHSDWI